MISLNKRLSLSKVPSAEVEEAVLQNLKQALSLNRRTQDRLKEVRNVISQRVKDLDQFISTSKLNAEFPPSTSLISYIQYQRRLPLSYKQQLKIVEFDNEGKVKGQAQDDDLFLKKLSRGKEARKHQFDVRSLPQNPHEIDFGRLWPNTQFSSGILLYRAWLSQRSKDLPKSKQLFSHEQDKLIVSLQKMYGYNWQKICVCLPNRSADQISYQFHTRINEKISKGRWSIRQTIMLIILVQHFSAGKWTLISHKMEVKNQLQVRQRYCNLVDPSIGKDVWTFQLQKKLLQVAQEYGYCWKKLSQLEIFKSKTDNSIWRKFKSLMIRFSQHQIKEMLPDNKQNRGLGTKILQEKRIVEKRKRSARNRPQPPIYFNQFKPKNIEGSNMVEQVKEGSNLRFEDQQYNESDNFLSGEKG